MTNTSLVAKGTLHWNATRSDVMDQFLDQETKIKGRTCGQVEIQLKIDYKWSVDR